MKGNGVLHNRDRIQVQRVCLIQLDYWEIQKMYGKVDG